MPRGGLVPVRLVAEALFGVGRKESIAFLTPERVFPSGLSQWMNGIPDKKAFALARVAMGDSRSLDQLASVDLVDAFKAARAAARALDNLVEVEAAELERRIGVEDDPAARRRLIRLRRRIRHRSGLAADPSDEARRVAAAGCTLGKAEESLAAVFAAAVGREREALRVLCQGSSGFRLSLLMSSISLSSRLDSWTPNAGPDSQRDAALLRYWTRFARKISPFSRFTAICCLAAEFSPGGVSLRPVSDAGALTRLNVQVLEQLEGRRPLIPALWQATPITLNPSFVWRGPLEVSFVTTGPKGAIDDLKLSVPQARLLRSLQDLGEIAWSKVATLVRRHLRIPVAQCRTVIQEMLTREIVVSVPPAHPLDADWLAAWSSFLDTPAAAAGGPDGEVITRLRDALGRLGAISRAGLSLDLVERRSQLDAVAGGYSELLVGAPAALAGAETAPPLRPEKLLFEDASVRLERPVVIAGYAELCRCLGKWGRAFATGRKSSVRVAANLEGLLAEHDVSFVEFLRLWTKAFGEQGKEPDDDSSEGHRWLRTELQRSRAAQPGIPKEIRLDSERLGPPVGEAKGCPPWHTCIVQPEDDGAGCRVILNSGVSIGPMRLWSRFCGLLPAEISEWLRESLADPEGETIQAEIVDWNFSNVNLHPVFTRTVILLSPGKPAQFEGEILRVSELTLKRSPGGAPRLFSRRLGKFVLPVDMGFQALGGHSAVYELLARLGGRESAPSASVLDLARECFGRHTPRIVLDGRVVVARETWHFSHADLPVRRKGQTLPEFFAATRDWVWAQGIPNEVFVRLEPAAVTTDPAAAGSPVRRRNRDDYKPIYHRFDSALFLLQWERLVDKAEDGLGIVEALPASPGNLDLGGTRHCGEIVLNWT